MSDWYILEGKTPVKSDEGFRSLANRRVAETTLGDFWVSTVFLGLDHSHGGKKPILFESMVFKNGIEFGNYTTRYTNWDCAERGHEIIVKKLRSSIDSQKEVVEVE